MTAAYKIAHTKCSAWCALLSQLVVRQEIDGINNTFDALSNTSLESQLAVKQGNDGINNTSDSNSVTSRR